jgi:hypothetical protein
MMTPEDSKKYKEMHRLANELVKAGYDITVTTHRRHCISWYKSPKDDTLAINLTKVR